MKQAPILLSPHEEGAERMAPGQKVPILIGGSSMGIVSLIEIDGAPLIAGTPSPPIQAMNFTVEAESLIPPEAFFALLFELNFKRRRRRRRALRRSLTRNRIEATRAFHQGEPWGIDPFKKLKGVRR